MPRENAMTTDFEEVTLLEKPALFTPLRIDPATVPQGYHCYDIRHDDDCQGDAVEVAPFVLVNHWGTVIMRDKLCLPPDGYLIIEPDAINYDTGDCRDMNAYMDKYPAKTDL